MGTTRTSGSHRRRVRGACLALAALTLTRGQAPAQDDFEPILDGDGILRIAHLLPDDEGFECIVPQEYSLGGLRLGARAEAVDRLGPPVSTSSGYGEDDGGEYIVYTRRYQGLTVEIVRDAVDVVTADGPQWPTPSGLEVGMTRTEVFARLGREPGTDYAIDDGYSFPGCPSPDGRYGDWMYFELRFDGGGRLGAVTIVADRP